MTYGEPTQHADTTGKIKESWGRENGDEGVEVEGQLQQVDAQTSTPDGERSNVNHDAVHSGLADDIDPERKTSG